MKKQLIALLLLSITAATHTPAATQQVKLPAFMQKKMASANKQLQAKLSTDDFAELLKGEMVWTGDEATLKKKLAEIHQAPKDDDIFSRAYIISSPQDGVQFLRQLQNQQDPILYADAQWVITRANGKGKHSSVYTFWDARTGTPQMELNLPGNVYCPTPTNVPGIYALQLTQNKRSVEDFYTWHGIPCTLVLVKPGDKSFATWYIPFNAKGGPCPSPKPYYKGLTETTVPYYISVSNYLSKMEQNGGMSIAEKTKVRKEIQDVYESVGKKYDQEAALTTLGLSAHLMPPIAIEQTASFRLPHEPFLAVMGDTSGKSASFTFSIDGARFVSLDFDTLSRTIRYIPEARGKSVSCNADGIPTPGASEQAVNELKRHLSPLPARLTTGIQKLVSLNNITMSPKTGHPDMSLFACNTGNYAWNVYDGAVVDELLGIYQENGGIFFLNPHSLEVNTQGKLIPYHTVVNKSDRGIIRGGSGAVQFAGRYRLMCILHTQEGVTEAIICKQTDRNKEVYTHLSINAATSSYTVLRRWDSTVYRLAPVWIAKKQWLLHPTSDNSYDILRINRGKEPEKLAQLFLSPIQDGYAIVLPDGRYAGSPGCERFLRNSTVGMSVFAPWRNRPADVLTALGGNPDDIEALKETTRRWLKKQGLDADNMPQEPQVTDLPTIHATLPTLRSDKAILPFSITIKAGIRPLTRLELHTDGLSQTTPKVNIAPGKSAKIQLAIPLAPGQNNIEITPIDSDNIAGDSLKFRIIGPGDTEKSDLYVVAMGVSAYDDAALNLQYAAKDATDIAESFRTYGKGDKKHILLLTDKQVKDESIMKQVDAFLSPAKPNDKVVLYLAGHGMLDDQLQYFYAPAAFDVEHIAGTGISMDTFRDCLQRTAARKRLLLLDTCHAGTLGEAGQDKLAASGVPLPHGVQTVQTRGMKIKKAGTDQAKKEILNDTQKKRYIEDFFSMDTQMRGINILAASAGAEFAQESGKWKNGVFTSSLMRALSRRAPVDSNADGLLSVEEMLHYISADVSTLTAQAQKPSVVSTEDTRGFHLSADLAWFVHRKDWAGLKAAALSNIDINEGAYPDTEGIICKALQQGAPEDALVTLLDNGANINRSQRVLVRGETLQETRQTPRMLINQDNSYVDFDGRKVDFCGKYGYPVLALRRLFQPYYAKHQAQFAPAATTTPPATPSTNISSPPTQKRIKSKLYR